MSTVPELIRIARLTNNTGSWEAHHHLECIARDLDQQQDQFTPFLTESDQLAVFGYFYSIN